MSQHVPLSVVTREERGSAKNSRLRKEGKLPGVLYQPGGDSLAFTADEYEVRRLIGRGGVRSAVIDLTIDSDAPRTVLFKQWDRDPVRDQITHLDLQEVDLTVEVEADVPVILIGSAVGIRDGGILDQTSLTVRVRAGTAAGRARRRRRGGSGRQRWWSRAFFFVFVFFLKKGRGRFLRIATSRLLAMAVVSPVALFSHCP